MPEACGLDICRRARCCRGPRGESRAFPGEELPACLAEAFEALYGPVLRWRALMDEIGRAEARLAESDAAPVRPSGRRNPSA